MSNPNLRITESHLKLNLNEEAHNFILELAMACRKMSIYGASHPTGVKAIEKPFLIAAGLLRFRRFISLNVQRGDLYLLNIRLKESPFTAQIIQFLQVLDVNAVLFDKQMQARDFSFFIETITTRQMVYNVNFSLAEHLKSHQVDTIQVNTELAYELFEKRKQYRGDVDGDFTLRRLALDQISDDPMRMALVRNANQEGLLDLLIDFEPDVISYLLPEKVAALDANMLHQILTELADQVSSGDTGPRRTHDATNQYMSVIKLVDSHPQKKQILENLSGCDNDTDSDESMSRTGAIKVETSARIDQLIEQLFSTPGDDGDLESFSELFVRLLKTGQQPKAINIVTRLMDLMSAADPAYRQTALNLLGMAVGHLSQAADASVVEAAVENTAARLSDKTETYEYSEFLWQLFEACRTAERYDLTARLTGAMAGRRAVTESVTVYDSMAVKKGFENISRRHIVRNLVDKLIGASGEQAANLRDTLSAIGSEEVAVALSEIISHPERSVRQLTLKILAELGKSSLKVFSRIVYDDMMFRRDENRHELPDEKWYVVRNSIFVLGSLRDPQGVPALRVRIDDYDVRVRREIIAALEKIGGEEAVDCLTLMAEDPILQIRRSAIIAIGLVGQDGDAPILIDLARRNPRNAIKAVTALGKLGGPDSRSFLGELLSKPEKLAELAGGLASKDDLRVAAVKALGHIGDQEAINAVKRFKENQSAAQKLLFKNSAVNKAITEVLARH